MKARLPHFVLLALPTLAHAQGLTYGQVYDFAIGDVFQTTDYWCINGCGTCPPFLYVQDSVMDRQLGSGGYQVLYTFQQQRYRAPGGPFAAEDTTLTYQWGIADSTAYPAHYEEPGGGTNCSAPYEVAVDTVLSNSLYCGRLHWMRYYAPCDTCFCFGPPSPWSSFFVLGCGGPYWSDVADSPTDICFGLALTYFKKDGLECGDEIAMSVHGKPDRSFTVFPDPVHDILNWTDAHAAERAEVLALNGTVMLDRGVASGRLDVSALSPGLYVLRLTGNDGRVTRSRFVKQ